MIEFNRKYTWGNGTNVYMLKWSKKCKLSLIHVSTRGAAVDKRMTDQAILKRHLAARFECFRYVD